MSAEHVAVRAVVSIADPRQAAQVRAALLRHGVFVVDPIGSDRDWCDGESAVQLIVAELQPTAIELARTLQRRCRTVAVFVARHPDPALLRQAAEVDDAGVVTVPVDERQLEATLRLAVFRQAVTRRRIAAGREVLMLGNAAAQLRPREQEIAHLLLQHKRVPAIAQCLGIAPETVRNHLKNAFRRTGTRSQQELLDWLSAHARASQPTPVSHSGHLPATGADDYPGASRDGDPDD
jgi:DNA-binding CsgD family transcriptional regulator